MLFKVARENETTYYVPEHIRKISISPMYGHEDSFDVAFYIDNTMEIVKYSTASMTLKCLCRKSMR